MGSMHDRMSGPLKVRLVLGWNQQIWFGEVQLAVTPFPGLVMRIGGYDMIKVHEVVVGDYGFDVTCICVLESGGNYTEKQIRAFGFEESAGYP